MKNIVILSGAGISAESGLKTFRASDGLWEEYPIEEVATLDGWKKNPERVLTFYNERRKQVRAAKPNAAHEALVALEKKFSVHIITQNIDDLHERAGSSKVMHLHGEINQARSSVDAELIYPIEHWAMKMGEICEKGSQLRPNIVWFGEDVLMINEAIPLVQQADIFIVIGTSLKVYPAAGLVNYTPLSSMKYHIDPNGMNNNNAIDGFSSIKQTATIGIPALVQHLLQQT